MTERSEGKGKREYVLILFKVMRYSGSNSDGSCVFVSRPKPLAACVKVWILYFVSYSRNTLKGKVQNEIVT